MFFAIYDSKFRSATVMDVTRPIVCQSFGREWHIIIFNPNTGNVEMTPVRENELLLDARARREAEVERGEDVDTYFSIRVGGRPQSRGRTHVCVFETELEAWKWMTQIIISTMPPE